MKRIGKRRVPPSLEDRENEILGEVKAGLMYDCLYNSIIADEVDETPANVDTTNLLPDFVKDYQRKDLSKALGQSVVFNINKPGYGKTLETILWIKIILKKGFNALILCPKSVIGTWLNQLDKYWPGWAKDGTWWITNYEQLYDTERFNVAKSFHWDVIVLDESHKIKSFRSKVTNICFSLESEHKHCLTGTPIKNRPEDIAAQLKWLDNYSITNYTDFSFAFCKMVRDRWGSVPKGLTKDKKMVNNLQRLLSIYCVGGKEHDIGSLVDPERIKVRLKLDPKVQALYNKTVGEYDKELKKSFIPTEELLKEGVVIGSPTEAAIRRQQIASNPGLFNSNYRNVKFEWIDEWLEGTDEKVLIMSKYAQTIDALEKFLLNKKHKVLTIRRAQSAKVREFNKNRWINENYQVLLGTFGVVGEGMDGLQEAASYGIFVDREWTFSANDQAERRLYRIGQKKNVFWYILQAIGTIDVKIERTQLDKGHDTAELLDPIGDDE